jgi:hypothetical protein
MKKRNFRSFTFQPILVHKLRLIDVFFTFTLRLQKQRTAFSSLIAYSNV